MTNDLQSLLDNIDARLNEQSLPVDVVTSRRLHDALRHHFGYAGFRPHQEQIIKLLLDGQSVLAILPTGSGKSLCYQLPALLLDGLTVVISPLISLMKDQVDQLRARGIDDVVLINSAQSLALQRRALARVTSGQAKLLYVAPERFHSRAFAAELSRLRISLFVVDEAHCISQWGHDFRPAYLALRQSLQMLRPRAVALFTATATPEIEDDMLDQLDLKNVKRIVAGLQRPNLHYSVRQVASEEAKLSELAGIVQRHRGKGIVYTARRREAEEVAAFLRSLGVAADCYHAGRSAGERQRVQDRFFDDGETGLRVVAATNAFGLGIDKRDLRFVVHYSLPGSLEAYVQEAGRAGRDGLPSACILLYWKEDPGLQKWFLRQDIMPKNELHRLMREAERAPGYESWRWLDPGNLEWHTGMSRTKLVVGLSHLQRLGFLRQYPHISSEVSVAATKRGRIESLLLQKVIASGSRVETLAFCRRYQMAPVELMSELYDAQWRGELQFGGAEDRWLVSLLRPASELARLSDSQLGMQEVHELKRKRLDQMMLYAIERGCRVQRIRRYFGDEAKVAESCGCCDVCAPAPATGTDLSRSQKQRVTAFLQQRQTPALKGEHFESGIALAFHTRIENDQHVQTETGQLVYAFKYQGNRRPLPVLLARAEELLQSLPEMAEVDTMAFVPPSLGERSFAPVPFFAENLRKQLGLRDKVVLKKTRVTRPQKEMATLEQKRRNVAGAFAVASSNAVNRHILLIDDIFDSGATVEECARMLKAAGAKSVRVLTLTKTGHVAK